MTVDRQRVLDELQALLREVWRDHPGDELDPGAGLSDVGVQSSAMLTFLVRAEQHFGFRWDPDLPAGAIGSLEGMADVVCDRLAGAERGR